MSTETKYSGEKLDEAQAYLNQHRIPEIVQSLMQTILVERPAAMAKQLQTMRSIRARNQNYVVFTRENLMGLFRYFDHVGRGYITMDQYVEGSLGLIAAMTTVGATKYNLKPTGYGLGQITGETFTEEALSALRKL
ncbi:EF-hand calcium-binding domain-containing protein 10 [Terramyces sp. JEL0728]|nr:EF-hand calcium-binding domain-containing protein 10 [Terramyces sp. JEL0728]